MCNIIWDAYEILVVVARPGALSGLITIYLILERDTTKSRQLSEFQTWGGEVAITSFLCFAAMSLGLNLLDN